MEGREQGAGAAAQSWGAVGALGQGVRALAGPANLPCRPPWQGVGLPLRNHNNRALQVQGGKGREDEAVSAGAATAGCPLTVTSLLFPTDKSPSCSWTAISQLKNLTLPPTPTPPTSQSCDTAQATRHGRGCHMASAGLAVAPPLPVLKGTPRPRLSGRAATSGAIRTHRGL